MHELPSQTLVENIKSRALDELHSISSQSDLTKWKTTYLGRKGELTQVLRSLSSVSPDSRKQIGASANAAKTELETCLVTQEQLLESVQGSGELLSEDSIDVTLPGYQIEPGRLHPTTQTTREICKIFSSMGFQTVEGPEVEWDKYNFEMLNIPKHHPARDMWNTFWIDQEKDSEDHPMLLRTHTSPMQARIMENNEPPIRMVVPGKCYRYEATDATHEWQLTQVEGLAVDDGISFTDLKGTLYEFAQRIFGEERKVRFRCDYFPFVEPGVDMSIDCFGCNGTGCRICSDTGWIEIMGAGMVHPNVLKSVGYDPNRYTGFAFGMGVERIAMLKHGINDVRLFYANDLRFLRQF